VNAKILDFNSSRQQTYCNRPQRDLDALSDWSTAWSMMFNVEKQGGGVQQVRPQQALVYGTAHGRILVST